MTWTKVMTAVEAISPLHQWFRERWPHDRDLTPDELAATAEALAAEPERWQALVRHDPKERVCVRLHRDQHLEAWLLCWIAEQSTGMHDHDRSSGTFRVVQGEVIEDRLAWGKPDFVSQRFGLGEGNRFDPTFIHQVRHGGGAPAASIHMYSPPLYRMGYYQPDADGFLYRSTIDYLDELATEP